MSIFFPNMYTFDRFLGYGKSCYYLSWNYSYVILKVICPNHTLVYSEIWMSSNSTNRQYDIILLPTLFSWYISNLPFPTDNLNIISCHLKHCWKSATRIGVLWALGLGHIVTAAVGDHNVVRLAEEGAVSSCDQDCGARGSPEQGHGAVVLLVRAPASQGADPGVSVSCLLKWSLCLDNRSIDLR